MYEPENWRPVLGYEGRYEVSDFGRVKRVIGGQGATAGKILAASKNNQGYRQVQFYTNGKRHLLKVHVLVMSSFCGPQPEDMEINHKDGSRENNALSNLEYVSHGQNMRHAIVIGRRKTKLTIRQVGEIKELLLQGQLTQKRIAEIYKVSAIMIHNIRFGKMWGWMTNHDDYGESYLNPVDEFLADNRRYVSAQERQSLSKNYVRFEKTIKFLSGRGDGEQQEASPATHNDGESVPF